MTVQARTDITNYPFILEGNAYDRDGQTLLQDAGRTADLVFGTLMSKVAATGKWVPFTDETATDGTAIPQGILNTSDIPFADIAAGDVADIKIIIGGDRVLIDKNQLTIENSKTLDTVIGAGTVQAKTVRDHLQTIGIFFTDTFDIENFAN